jgi:N-carbamoylputrescine amidase
MSSQIIKVAAIQFSADPGDIPNNLSRAESLVSKAAAQGAHIVLLPELAPGGYVLTKEIWNTAETMQGHSVAWLKATAKRLNIYLGMSFLEAEETDFYNSFVLATPSGEIAGRVRKNPPASAEAYFFRAGNDEHFIDTDIGRMGVSICYEALLYERLAEHQRNGIDLLLIPMSAGTPTPIFPIRKKDCISYDKMLLGLASHHARTLGVPTVMANKCGPLVTAMPAGMPFQDSCFPGLSTIAGADGRVAYQLGDAEGIGIAEVELNPTRKTKSVPRSYGRWALPVPWFTFFFPLAAFFGSRAYAKSKVRSERALALDQGMADPSFQGTRRDKAASRP